MQYIILTELIWKYILWVITVFHKLYHLWDIVAKYGTAGQDKDDSMIRHMCIACCRTEASDTHWVCNTDCYFWQLWLCKLNSLLSLYVQCVSCLLHVSIYIYNVCCLLSGCSHTLRSPLYFYSIVLYCANVLYCDINTMQN
jgi:hypothetical protein